MPTQPASMETAPLITPCSGGPSPAGPPGGGCCWAALLTPQATRAGFYPCTLVCLLQTPQKWPRAEQVSLAPPGVGDSLVLYVSVPSIFSLTSVPGCARSLTSAVGLSNPPPPPTPRAQASRVPPPPAPRSPRPASGVSNNTGPVGWEAVPPVQEVTGK